MLSAAESFGHSTGWPAQERFSDAERRKLLDGLAPDLRTRVLEILEAGRRVPEEILGPEELRIAWSRTTMAS